MHVGTWLAGRFGPRFATHHRRKVCWDDNVLGGGCLMMGSLVGKSIWNSAEFRNYSDSGHFELRNFHWNFIFLIVKCVPANFEHVSSCLESSPTINSSNTFPLYISVVSGIKFRASTHQLFLHAPSPSHCSRYLPDTHKFMKALLTYQGIGIVVEVPIQEKNGSWWQRSHWFSIRLQSGIQDRSTLCSWFHLGLSRHNPWHYQRWWW